MANFDLLPKITADKTLAVPHFPTEHQTVIFRLWEMVDAKLLAEVLETTEENVNASAREMGLPTQRWLSEWMSRGYISILRQVWHLLPYEQILKLLGCTEERLAFILKEDDFLGIKLGEKPDCKPVLWRELTDEEKARTAEIKADVEQLITPLYGESTVAPFDFYSFEAKPLVSKANGDVTVDGSWGIKYPSDTLLSKMVEDFKAFTARYGVKLEGTDKLIEIELSAKTDDEEYHEVHISKDGIRIVAATAVGALRGIYELENQAITAGLLNFKSRVIKKKTKIKTRYIYSFSGLYTDVLECDTRISFPDELLERYGRCGVNGIWIQGVLYTLAPYPFDETKCEGWETRLERLRDLSERALRYGVKVYIYINEPRAMPLSFFEKRPDLKGALSRGNDWCLCTSHPDVQKYLYDSIHKICEYDPMLGGFLAITQSENLTTCYSKSGKPTECPVCSKRTATEVTADAINPMARAASDVNPAIKFLAYAWVWDKAFKDQIGDLLDRLEKNVIVMMVSETQKPYNIAGVEGVVGDYSLSIVGPGESAKSVWSRAKEAGLEVAAKVQFNTSWECSTAPFLPVYDNVVEHIKNLSELGIEHLMLSWTHGGWCSDSLKIASAYYFEDSENSTDPYSEILDTNYGEWADKVRSAATHFTNGFKNYPFSVANMYDGPSNAGASNLLYPEQSGMKPTMTCYPFDDVDVWRWQFPRDVFEDQYKRIVDEWQVGLESIKDMPACEFADMAEYGYTLFAASYNQVKYYNLRDSGTDVYKEKDIVRSELDVAVRALKVMLRNPSVGYEAANHYYVSRSTLMEKIVQCAYLLRK